MTPSIRVGKVEVQWEVQEESYWRRLPTIGIVEVFRVGSKFQASIGDDWYSPTFKTADLAAAALTARLESLRAALTAVLGDGEQGGAT